MALRKRIIPDRITQEEPSPTPLFAQEAGWWPSRRVRLAVVQFEFRVVPRQHASRKTFWLVLGRQGSDVCLKDPGFAVDLTVTADLATLTRVWMGDVPLADAMHRGLVRVEGPRDLIRAGGWSDGQRAIDHPLDHRVEQHHVDRLFQDGDARQRGARVTDGWRPRDDDDRHLRIPLAHPHQDFPARHARHQQIGEHDVIPVPVEQGEGLDSTAGGVGAVTQGADEIHQHVADDGVVVHQEDPRAAADARHALEYCEADAKPEINLNICQD